MFPSIFAIITKNYKLLNYIINTSENFKNSKKYIFKGYKCTFRNMLNYFVSVQLSLTMKFLYRNIAIYIYLACKSEFIIFLIENFLSLNVLLENCLNL